MGKAKAAAAAGTPVSPVLAALMDHRVTATIKDLDHYRIHGGMAVETDYIIEIKCGGTGKKTRSEPDFEDFNISKTFSAFRTLTDQLSASAEKCMNSSKKGEKFPIEVKKLARFCEIMAHLIDSQKTNYLGKVNFTYVKALSKQRQKIIVDVLDSTLAAFPQDIDGHPFLAEVAKKIEAFFLTDHCASEDVLAKQESKSNVFGQIDNMFTPAKKNYPKNESVQLSTKATPSDERLDIPGLQRKVTSPVVPLTRKTRRSERTRQSEESELAKESSRANLLIDDDRDPAAMVPSYRAPMSTVSGTNKATVFLDNNPIVFAVIFAVALRLLKEAGGMEVTADLDLLLLVGFACFCVGLHMPRPMVGGIDKPPLVAGGKRSRGKAGAGAGGPGTPRNAANLLRRSMAVPRGSLMANASLAASLKSLPFEEDDFEDEEDEAPLIQSPMPRFPKDAPLGSVCNCFSEAPASGFKVRGDNYLSDRKKVPSGDYLFPCRGVDLFLTDACPENVGRINGIMGGELRDVPTFIINFRLPWGVLLFYYEIPDRFTKFIKGCYKDPSVKRADLEAEIKKMTNNQDRCCARFLLGDQEHKNNTLKIFPGVVQGPWVVKSVVGGKPAIIGTKLPVNYVYAPESTTSDGTKQCLYLEADLDIVSSSAARGILSAVRSYTQELTLDLGFGIQGNSTDELREQMLTGTRLHGIDPLSAPPLPPMKGELFDEYNSADSDDDSTTER